MVPSSFLTVASLGLAGVPTAHVPQPVPSFQDENKTKQNSGNKWQRQVWHSALIPEAGLILL